MNFSHESYAYLDNQQYPLSPRWCHTTTDSSSISSKTAASPNSDAIGINLYCVSDFYTTSTTHSENQETTEDNKKIYSVNSKDELIHVVDNLHTDHSSKSYQQRLLQSVSRLLLVSKNTVSSRGNHMKQYGDIQTSPDSPFLELGLFECKFINSTEQSFSTGIFSPECPTHRLRVGSYMNSDDKLESWDYSSQTDSTAPLDHPWETSVLYTEVYEPELYVEDKKFQDFELDKYIASKEVVNSSYHVHMFDMLNNISALTKMNKFSSIYFHGSEIPESIENLNVNASYLPLVKQPTNHVDSKMNGDKDSATLAINNDLFACSLPNIRDNNKKSGSIDYPLDNNSSLTDHTDKNANINPYIVVTSANAENESEIMTAIPNATFRSETFNNHPTMLSSLVDMLNSEMDQSEAYNAPRGLTLGGGAPTQGTRHRIRARVSVPTDDLADGCEDELLQGGLADGLLISEREVETIRRNVWQPKGRNIPHPSLIRMGYHTAWDIGKKGCVGMKLRNKWESSVNPNRLRFYIMDGTDPYCFLSIYGKNDLQNLMEPDGKKGVIRATDIRDALWDYRSGRLEIHRTDKGGQLLILDKLPCVFIDAMIVCLREMEVCREVNGLKGQRLLERRAFELRGQKKKWNVRLSTTSLPVCDDITGKLSTSTGLDDASIGRRSQVRDSLKDIGKDPSFAIGATRQSAKSMVTPNSALVASVVELTRKSNSNKFGDILPPRTHKSGKRRLRFLHIGRGKKEDLSFTSTAQNHSMIPEINNLNTDTVTPISDNNQHLLRKKSWIDSETANLKESDTQLNNYVKTMSLEHQNHPKTSPSTDSYQISIMSTDEDKNKQEDNTLPSKIENSSINEFDDEHQ